MIEFVLKIFKRNKIIKITQKVLVLVLGFLLGLLVVASGVLQDNKTVINAYLGLQGFEFIEGNESDAEDLEYYKSDYTTIGEVIEQGKKIPEDLIKEGAVLLKNDNNALPLTSDEKKVTVFGVASADPIYGGTGSGSVNTQKAVSLIDGLKDAGLELNPTMEKAYAGKWFTDTYKRKGKSRINGVPWNEVLAENSGATDGAKFIDYNGAAIYVIGRVGGEGSDLSYKGTDGTNGDYLQLNQIEKDNLIGLKALKDAQVFEKVVVIYNGAQCVQMDFLFKEEYGVDACLWVGTYGQNGASAVGKLLTGEYNPSGHLSDTLWYENAQNPVNVNFGAFDYTNKSEFDNLGLPSSNDTIRKSGTYVVYQEGMYVGYKYTETRYEDFVLGTENVGEFDYEKTVAFPFGYGLSYTKFKYSDFSVSGPKDGKYTVSITVTNIGEKSGQDAVQIYIAKPNGQYAKDNGIQVPSVQLVNFDKTRILGPKESQPLTIEVEEKYFATYDANNEKTYVRMEGDYYLIAASDSHTAVNNLLAAKKVNNDKIVGDRGDAQFVKKLSLGYDNKSFTESNDTKITNLFEHADINKYKGRGNNSVEYYNRNNWAGTVSLDKNDYVKLEMTQTMVNEILIQIPEGNVEGGAISAPLPTDEAYYSKYPEQNIHDMKYPNYGVGRINDKQCAITLVSMRLDSEGNEIAYDDPIWDVFMDQLTWDEQVELVSKGIRMTAAIESIAKPQTADPNGPNGFSKDGGKPYYYKESKLGYAYRSEAEKGNVNEDGSLNESAIDPDLIDGACTSLPNSGIIASTFNKKLAYEAGKIIGEDAIWAGCSGIYGLGTNIHRTNYCGRTAEYYSEDGILTGWIAGYQSKGIEEKGCHVYNKHSALNDQENNRHGICTWINEQAFRENYLVAFKMPIEIGNAHNIMAGFNRIGVQACAGSTSLNQHFLREECGLKGFVITDYAGPLLKYFNLTYGIYYSGCDLPDSGSQAGLFSKYAPDENNEGDYSRMAWQIRESAKRICYTVCHSNAMNGISSNTRIRFITVWWENLVVASITIVSILFSLIVIWSLLTIVLPKIVKNKYIN